MSLKDKKAILLDVYGTLISTGNGSITATTKILNKNNISINPADFYAVWKKIHKRNMQCINGFKSEKNIFLDDLVELYNMYSIKSNAADDVVIMLDSLYNRKVFTETHSSLKSLSKRYELIIASNTDTEPLLQNLQYNGLEFNKIYTSESLSCYKPNISFYQQILESTGYQNDEVIFIGDSEADDILGPRQLDIATIRIDRKGNGTAKTEADLVLDSLPDTSILNNDFTCI